MPFAFIFSRLYESKDRFGAMVDSPFGIARHIFNAPFNPFVRMAMNGAFDLYLHAAQRRHICESVRSMFGCFDRFRVVFRVESDPALILYGGSVGRGFIGAQRRYVYHAQHFPFHSNFLLRIPPCLNRVEGCCGTLHQNTRAQQTDWNRRNDRGDFGSNAFERRNRYEQPDLHCRLY